MTAFWQLVFRHQKVFRRDKMQVFFSLLSIIIVIALYIVFLQNMQLDAIAQVTTVTDATKAMVNEWLVAGLLSMMAVTTTLGAFGIFVQDRDGHVSIDFLTSPMSRIAIQLSYVVHAWMIGLLSTVLAFSVCIVFLGVTSGSWLTIGTIAEVLGLLTLSVLLASACNMLVIVFLQSQQAFSTFATLVGTLLGFLCGIYIPFGVVPSFIQTAIMYFPISHTTLLLRQALMEDSMASVFMGAPASEQLSYMLQYGIVYELHGTLLSTTWSVVYIVAWTVGLGIAGALLFMYKKR